MEYSVVRLPNDNSLKAVYMTYFAVGIVLPGSVVVYRTIRIVIVVRRTHRQISALEHSVALLLLHRYVTSKHTCPSLFCSEICHLRIYISYVQLRQFVVI